MQICFKELFNIYALKSDLQYSEAELEPGGEDVGEEAAGRDDPAPVALGVVVLPERGRLAVAPQRCKERTVNKAQSISFLSSEIRA